MRYRLDLYRVDTVTGAFTRFNQIDGTFYGLQFVNKLNGVGSATFQMSVFDPRANTDVLRRYRTNVSIVRIDENDNELVVWFGPIVKISGEFQDVGGMVTIECSSYLYHLVNRYTAQQVIYSGVDAGQIAWALINTTQAKTNGHLGITQGTIETTRTRQRTYEFDEVAQSIVNLTNVIGGFDFELVPVVVNGLIESVAFNVYASMGRVRTDLPLLQIGAPIQKIILATQDTIANAVVVIGQGTDNSLNESSDDEPSQMAYTRREYIEEAKDVVERDTLTDKANAALNLQKVERYDISVELNPSIRPFFNEINLGDALRLDLRTTPASYFDFEFTARIVELEVSVDSQAVETVSPKLNIIV